MGYFCKGVLIGMAAGVCVGAIVVAKNKKLSNKLKESLVTAEGKIKEIKDNLSEKVNEFSCDNSNCKCVDEYSGESEIMQDNNASQQKNNFSKKNKND